MPLKTKKIPNRMCLGCRVMNPKKELLRIVKSQDGIISVDNTGKKPGRGAYICFNIECLDKAQKSRRFEKEFKTSISPEVFGGIREELKVINDNQ